MFSTTFSCFLIFLLSLLESIFRYTRASSGRTYEGILGELEILPGFIIGGHHLSNIRDADDTVLIVDTDAEDTSKQCNNGKREEKANLQL